jgi:predicted nucleic acid-binding protein
MSMKISEALEKVNRLAVEASPFIYYVEDHPVYGERLDAIFAIIEARNIEICTSAITLTETLMKPVQLKDIKLQLEYRDLLRNTEYISLISVTPVIAEKAATLRATYNLRTPDALHIATALVEICDAFLTNDRALKRVNEIRVILLDDLETIDDEETTE